MTEEEQINATGERLDPEHSACVIIGVYEYTVLDPLPTVRNNLGALKEILTDEDIWGISEPRCQVVANPATPAELVRPVRKAAETAKDTLLVYYAGHGFLDLRDEGLYLTLPDSVTGETYTAVSYQVLRRVIQDHCSAKRRIVILDCCYSGRALERMSASESLQQAASMENVQGSYLLTSTAENRRALSPRKEQYTAFTGEFISVLFQGDPDGPHFLTLDSIYRRVKQALASKGRPTPEQQDQNGVGSLNFVRNKAKEKQQLLPVPAKRRRGRYLLVTGMVVAVLPAAAGWWLVWGDRQAAGPCSNAASLIAVSDQLDQNLAKYLYNGESVQGLSALALTGRSEAWALADNAPGRIYKLSLDSPPNLDVRVTRMVTLRNKDGLPYDGHGPGRDFDGEGLVVEKGEKTVLVSSEKSPVIHRFQLSSGREQDTLPIPEQFQIHPTGQALSGRQLESLAVTPDGRFLFAGLEGPLHSDSDDRGRNQLRIQRYQGSSGGRYDFDGQYAYLAEAGSHLVELVAFGPDRLLALERSYVEGQGNTIRVFDVSLDEGRDITGIESLFSQPADIFANKRLLVDLATCPPGDVTAQQVQPNPLLDNVEGMALGEPLTGGEYKGRRPLYLVSDNNNRSQQVTRVYLLAAHV